MDKNKTFAGQHSSDALNDIERIKYTENLLNLSEKLMRDEKTLSKLNGYTLNIIKKYAKHHSINGKEPMDFIEDAILIIA